MLRTLISDVQLLHKSHAQVDICRPATADVVTVSPFVLKWLLQHLCAMFSLFLNYAFLITALPDSSGLPVFLSPVTHSDWLTVASLPPPPCNSVSELKTSKQGDDKRGRLRLLPSSF